MSVTARLAPDSTATSLLVSPRLDCATLSELLHSLGQKLTPTLISYQSGKGTKNTRVGVPELQSPIISVHVYDQYLHSGK